MHCQYRGEPQLDGEPCCHLQNVSKQTSVERGRLGGIQGRAHPRLDLARAGLLCEYDDGSALDHPVEPSADGTITERGRSIWSGGPGDSQTRCGADVHKWKVDDFDTLSRHRERGAWSRVRKSNKGECDRARGLGVTRTRHLADTLFTITR